MTEKNNQELCEAIKRISYGDAFPTGFEALAMALCGEGLAKGRSVSDGLFAIAGAIQSLADAMEVKP